MGKTKPLNLLATVARLTSTCSRPHPFCLHLGDHALAPSVLTPCAYMHRQRQETSRQAMEGNAERAYERGMKQINMIDMASIACEKANT